MARYYSDYPAYVSAAERRRKARTRMQKAIRTGAGLSPVYVEAGGRKIASSFWGRAWCENLEAYSDYANRLPRGRTYVRNGSVIDLRIEGGTVRAKVSGSSLYTVIIQVAPVAERRWADVKAACAGQIRSVLEVLRGQLSDEVMRVVTRKGEGLFPTPREIELSCSCPDWASMCKHVAATLYGVGVRLDEAPELLFQLRGLNPEELVSAAVLDPTGAADETDRKVLGDDSLTSIFGVDIDLGGGEPAIAPRAEGATPKLGWPSAKAPPTRSTAAAKRSMGPKPTRDDAALERLRARADELIGRCEVLAAMVDEVRLTRGRVHLMMGPGQVFARISPVNARTVLVEAKEGTRWVDVDRGSLPAVLRRMRAGLLEDE